MALRNHTEALRRLGNLLASVEQCVLNKLDATGDAYVPTPGKKEEFDARFTALFSQVKNRNNLTVLQFQGMVNTQIQPALDDWINTDGLPCTSNVLLGEIGAPFDPPHGGDGSGGINP